MVSHTIFSSGMIIVLAFLNFDKCRSMQEGLTGRYSKPTCVNIPRQLSLCQDIGYSRMRMPNLLDHESLSEVQTQSVSWLPLVRTACHEDVKLFLCSLFTPVCLDRPIYPCRSLCEEVKRDCEPVMSQFCFPWPEMLRCDKYPEDNNLCITAQMGNASNANNSAITSNTGQEKLMNVYTQCHNDAPASLILEYYCKAEFVIRVKIDKVRDSTDGKKYIANKKKRKIYKKGTLKKRDLNRLTFWATETGFCNCDIITKGNDFYLVMGKKAKDNKLIMTFAHTWVTTKDFRYATRRFKKTDCRN
ncbi:secreted frizzled-related protein 5-like [Anneissia japonica]|uniref:secreted frizzled-related protein 5-like n=1 Tax=Anneissia japonica TaxID=1529436 RepID=UPI0014257433|nr:secreted frizzled-related protein 5-like [Anneissia japonica]